MDIETSNQPIIGPSKVKDEGVRQKLGKELTLMKVKTLYQTAAGSNESLAQTLNLLEGEKINCRVVDPD
jgi:hypothetical protein